MAKKTWEPRMYPIRDPRNAQKDVGRVVNPPRALKVGGKGEARIFPAGSTTLRVTDRGKGAK